MFIRRRVKKSKDGNISVSFQAVESYRRSGKIRQRVISLGEHPDPRDALEEELLFMKSAEKCYEFPLSEWKETRLPPGGDPYRVKLPEKQARKRREFWRKIYERHKKRVGLLESVASKHKENKYISDTTISATKHQEKEAVANLRQIRELISQEK